MRILLLLTAVVLLSTGCTVISYDRVFPKFTWYWSKEAKEQRKSRSLEHSYYNSSVLVDTYEQFQFKENAFLNSK